jgi:hypothetical protein
MSNNYLNYLLSYLSTVPYRGNNGEQDARREREEKRREKGATLKIGLQRSGDRGKNGISQWRLRTGARMG